VNDTFITEKKQVADLIAANISTNSSTSNYSSDFQKVKTVKEKRRLDFSTKNEEEYNLPFSLNELKQSLQRSNDSATGLDQIHYQLLTHLPDSTLSVLLQVYNNI
jgi:UDP-galactopyranose mutase